MEASFTSNESVDVNGKIMIFSTSESKNLQSVLTDALEGTPSDLINNVELTGGVLTFVSGGAYSTTPYYPRMFGEVIDHYESGALIMDEGTWVLPLYVF